jgi:MoaA/NifB/PqqE/SkfB family radical SAM enzyme
MTEKRGAIRFTRFLRQNAIFLGIEDGRFAPCGPQVVWIDLTNKCTQHCLCCWNYSPLIDPGGRDPSWFTDELDYDRFKKLLGELKGMGAKEIFYSGGGDPLHYPRLREVIHETAAAGMKITLITNLVTDDEKLVDFLGDAPIDRMLISIWAASEDVYRKIRPLTPRGVFTSLVGRLRDLLRTISGNGKKEVILNHVLLRQNFREFVPMAEMAYELGASNVWYTTMDLAHESMRPFLLGEKDIAWLLPLIERSKRDFRFGGRAGWHFEPSQMYELEKRLRNSRAAEGVYHSDYIDDVPCYAGWTVARITADGGVCPCCKADRMPLGNVYRDSFSNIWYGAKYNEFRRNAKTLSKRHEYFSAISCWRVCDNWIHNVRCHASLNEFKKGLDSWAVVGKGPLRRIVTQCYNWFPRR